MRKIAIAIKISATTKLWFGNKCDWELCREKWVQVKERFFNMATRKNMYEIEPKDSPLLQHDVKERYLMEFPSTGECKFLCLGNGV